MVATAAITTSEAAAARVAERCRRDHRARRRPQLSGNAVTGSSADQRSRSSANARRLS